MGTLYCTFTLVLWPETSQWKSWWNLHSKWISTHLPSWFIDDTWKASHNDQYSSCLVSATFCLILSVTHTQMVCNHGQSSLKTLLHNYGKHHKTHSMMIKQEDQTTMYNDADKTPTPHDTAPLDTTLSTQSLLDLDCETASEYSEDTKPQRDLVLLCKHCQQLQERCNELGSTTSPPAHTEELEHLTDKLQQLAITLQPC